MGKLKSAFHSFFELKEDTMDTRSVERYILLNCPNDYARHEIKSKFFNAGVGISIFAPLCFGVIFIAFERITSLFVIFSILLIPFATICSIKHAQRRIQKIFNGNIDNRRILGIKAGIIAGLVGGSSARGFPELSGLMMPYLIVCLWWGAVSAICGYFYLVYLLKKYCPYLETPEDRQYNLDIQIVR